MIKIINVPSGSTILCILRSGQEKKIRAPIAIKLPLILGRARIRN